MLTLATLKLSKWMRNNTQSNVNEVSQQTQIPVSILPIDKCVLSVKHHNQQE